MKEKKRENIMKLNPQPCVSWFSLSLILCASLPLSSHIRTPWEGGGADLGSTPQP